MGVDGGRAEQVFMLGDIAGPGHYHVGDEAMFTACVDWMRGRFPALRITALSAEPEFSSSTTGVVALSRPELPKGVWRRLDSPWAVSASRALAAVHRRLPALDWRGLGQLSRAVSCSRLLHICGGGNLTSLFQRELRIRSLVALVALEEGIPVVLSGQTLGPDFTERDRALMESWLPRVSRLGLRDELSSPAIALEMGVPESRISIQPDDAFDLKERPVRDPGLDRLFEEASSRPLVGLTLHRRHSSGTSRKELIERAASLLDAFVAATGARLLFLPHLTRSGELSLDLEVGEAVRGAMSRSDALHLVRGQYLDREVKYLTGRCQFVISTRYHGLIFALSSGVPCVGLTQDRHTDVKMRGAFGVMGAPERTLDLQGAGLFEELMRFWNEREELRSQILAGAPAALARLQEAREGIAALLGGPNGPRRENSGRERG